MNSEDYKTNLTTKINDCATKIEYYRGFTDNVTAAKWQGRKEAYEEALKMFEEFELDITKDEIKTPPKQGKLAKNST